MADVTIRQLRNEGGAVIDRVMRGEVLTVTRNGRPVARLVPLPKVAASAEEILQRWRNLPPMDYESLRRDVDEIIDPSL